MNLKKMWRTANRGVIIGVILLIALTIYIVVNHFTFKAEKEDIKNAADNYVKEYMAALPASGDAKSLKAWDQKTADTEKEKFTKLIEKHFTTSEMKDSAMMSSFASRKDAVSQLDAIYANASSNKEGFVTEANYSTTKYSIKEYGPNGALISFTVDCEITSNGSPYMPTLDFKASNIYGDPAASLKSQTNHITMDVSFKMLHEDGTWKIAKVYSLISGMSGGME